jgi:hypothetical protein
MDSGIAAAVLRSKLPARRPSWPKMPRNSVARGAVQAHSFGLRNGVASHVSTLRGARAQAIMNVPGHKSARVSMIYANIPTRPHWPTTGQSC